jgi:hypothetical protein
MRYPKFTVARSRLIPLAALLLATVLSGCVAYTGYPSSTYGNNYPGGYYSGYPSGYYAGYPNNYTYPSGPRPFYSPTYYSNPTSYENNGGSGGGNG